MRSLKLRVAARISMLFGDDVPQTPDRSPMSEPRKRPAQEDRIDPNRRHSASIVPEESFSICLRGFARIE